MRRGKIEERENLYKDFDLQQYVLAKSDDKCCHCGQKKFFRYGATIDHFIPLSQGGTNRKHNLIMLCEDCNLEKGNKIKDLSYVPYLKDKYKKELFDYYQSYINSFEYIDRKKLLASDEYSIFVESPVGVIKNWNKRFEKKIKNFKPLYKPYKIKSADEEDFYRIFDFLCDYCEKNKMAYCEEHLEMQLAFWYKFSAIYYIEDTSQDIMFVFVMLLAPNVEFFRDEVPLVLRDYVFSKYSTDNAINIALNSSDELPKMIMEEQHLKCLPVITSIYHGDRLGRIVLPAKAPHPDYVHLNQNNGMFYEVNMKMTSKEEVTEDGKVSMQKFIDNFKDSDETKQKIAEYFREYMVGEINWLIYDLLTPHEVKKYGIFDEGTEQWNYNEELIERMDKFVNDKDFIKKQLGDITSYWDI